MFLQYIRKNDYFIEDGSGEMQLTCLWIAFYAKCLLYFDSRHFA